MRQKEIEKLGVKFLRFDDSEIYFNMANVIKTIEDWVDAHTKSGK